MALTNVGLQACVWTFHLKKKYSLAGAVKGLSPCLVNFDLFHLKGIMSLPRLFLKVYLIVHYTLSMVLAGKAEFCYN